MFIAQVFAHSTGREIGVGSGKTVAAAIAAASTVLAKNGSFPQINGTVGVRIYEDSDNGKAVVFTAYDYGVSAALKTAGAMNRKSRAGNGR